VETEFGEHSAIGRETGLRSVPVFGSTDALRGCGFAGFLSLQSLLLRFMLAV